MLNNYLKIAWRNLLKGKFYSFINIFGLSVAVAVCLLIGLYILHEMNFDRFHSNADRLYRVVNTLHGNAGTMRTAQTSPSLAPLLEERFPEVERAVRIRRDFGAVRVNGRIFEQEIFFADHGFFDLFDYRLVSGRPEIILTQPDNIILTRSAAERFFGSMDVSGKTLDVRIRQEYYTFTVAGVMEDPPLASSLQFEVLLPVEFHKTIEPQYWGGTNWRSLDPQTYLLLRRGSAAETFAGEADRYIQAQLPEGIQRTHQLQNISEVHFDTESRGSFGPVTNPNLIFMLGIIAIFILVIACINFTILTIGYSTRRAREVGMRKALGAQQAQIRGQFWGETFVMALIALLIGLLLTELFLPAFNRLVETPVEGLSLSPGLLMIVFMIVAVTGLLAGSYPAIYLSRFRPTEVLKGTLKVEGKHTLTRVLTTFQFSLSIFLMIATLFINRQMNHMLEKELGYNEEQIIMINGPASPEGQRIIERLRSILQNDPDVLGVSGSWNRLGSAEGVAFQDLPVTSEGGEVRAFSLGSDYNLAKLLDIELLEGRFLDEHSAEKNEVLINRRLAELFGWDCSAWQPLRR